MLPDLIKIKVGSAISVLFTAATISIGLLYIFLWDRDLFISLDILKQLLLSLPFTGSTLAINFSIVLIFTQQIEKKETVGTEILNVLMLTSCFITDIILGIPLLLKLTNNIDLKTAMGTVLVIQLFVCFIVWARIEFKEISEKLRALKEKRRAFEERKRAARNENF